MIVESLILYSIVSIGLFLVLMLIISLHVNGLTLAAAGNEKTGKGMLLFDFKRWCVRNLHPYIHKPLISCYVCMVSFHSFYVVGSILSSIYLFLWLYTSSYFLVNCLFLFPLMPIVITCSCTVNKHFFSWSGTMQDYITEIEGVSCSFTEEELELECKDVCEKTAKEPNIDDLLNSLDVDGRKDLHRKILEFGD